MSIFNLNISETPGELAEKFAAELLNKIADLLEVNEHISIALSGGKTPQNVFKVLASGYKQKINWNALRFYWVDERCVPPDDKESNFGNAYKLLFSKLDISPSSIHRIKGEANAEEEAERYSELVKMNVRHKNSLPCFDIMLLGLGEDGHTASIFPDNIKLMYSGDIYAVSQKPGTTEKRVTVSGKVINNSDNIYFLVSGASKAEVFNKIRKKDAEAETFPAALVHPLTGELRWFADSAAAGF